MIYDRFELVVGLPPYPVANLAQATIYLSQNGTAYRRNLREMREQIQDWEDRLKRGEEVTSERVFEYGSSIGGTCRHTVRPTMRDIA